MKKLTIIALSACLLFSLTACGSAQPTKQMPERSREDALHLIEDATQDVTQDVTAEVDSFEQAITDAYGTLEDTIGEAQTYDTGALPQFYEISEEQAQELYDAIAGNLMQYYQALFDTLEPEADTEEFDTAMDEGQDIWTNALEQILGIWQGAYEDSFDVSGQLSDNYGDQLGVLFGTEDGLEDASAEDYDNYYFFGSGDSGDDLELISGSEIESWDDLGTDSDYVYGFDLGGLADFWSGLSNFYTNQWSSMYDMYSDQRSLFNAYENRVRDGFYNGVTDAEQLFAETEEAMNQTGESAAPADK